MDKYAIYSYEFVDVTREGELFKEDNDTQSDSSEEKRKVWLDRLFGEKNTLFTVKKQNKNDADDLPCTVLAHSEKFVLLRLENPKHISVWIKKQPKTAGEAAPINKQRLESNPYVFIIIDCRNGKIDPVSAAFLRMAYIFSELEKISFVLVRIVSFKYCYCSMSTSIWRE